MPRHIPVLVALTVIGVAAADPVDVCAQTTGLVPASPVSTQAAMHSGRIKGVVRDDAGQAVRDASIVAMGTIVAAVRTDARGQFSLALPPGEYLLRALCEGYASAYREPIRIQSSAQLQRNITLTRQGVTAPSRPVVLASAGGFGTPATPGAATTPEPGAAGDPAPGDHAHTAAAWRLRHLTRSILRDGAPADDVVAPPTESNQFTPRASFFDRAVVGSARLATALFAGTDFDGQVNFLTTSAMSSGTGWMPSTWPRGIAYLAVGAPVGRHGDWRMRGAITAGDASSWVLLGEFQAREDATHAFRTGVSYSAQGYDPRTSSQWSAATTEARNVAGVYGYDRWQFTNAIALDYGVRLDRYDYVASPNLISPEVGARVRMVPHTYVIARAARWMIAPGADEFLPPETTGPWVPPERTFSSLVPLSPLRPESVGHYEIGVEQEFGSARRHRVEFRRFRQSVDRQVATIFGLGASDVGHYYVATPGSAELDGWSVGASTAWLGRFNAKVEYSAAVAEWERDRQSWAVRRVAPSAIRSSGERLHDLAATLKADLSETRTRVTVIYRFSTAFSQAQERTPDAAGRFDLELRQALPYRPPGGGRLDVIVAVRTLMREPRERGSFYDELLTVAPPLRLVGGVQMKF